MAKVKLNPLLESIRGQVGDLVFRRHGDEVVLSRKPDLSAVEPTAAQLAQRERFSRAALYGRIAMADPETKALYQEAADARGMPVFSLTVADFFNAPSIDQVDLSGYNGNIGDEITIMASDDFAVIGVQVILTDGDGNPIEQGDAAEMPGGSGRWVYIATMLVSQGTLVHIDVTASDRPGGVGEAAQEKTI